MSTTRAFAQAVGALFKVDNVTYEITVRDLTHPGNNTVAVYKIEGSGTVTVPATVKNTTDKETYKVTSVKGWLNNQLSKTVTEIVFSEGLLEILDGAFRRAEGVKKVHIPASCTKFGAAFAGCGDLKEFVVAGGNTAIKAVDGVLFTTDDKELVMFPAGKGADNDELETHHADYAIPNGVTNIGIDAFGYSEASTVTFAENGNLDLIESRAFYYMPNVEHITLPASLRQINDNAFTYMGKLKTITVKDNSNLAVLNTSVFAQNPELTTVTFEGNTPNLKTVTFGTPSQLTNIGEAAFAEADIESIAIPSTVNTIKKQAFDNCHKLQTIKIPAATTTIETGAFNLCESLTAINVEESNSKFASLGGMLTDKNKKILKVFPAGKADSKYTLIPYFEKVDEYAFYGSEKISNITFPRTVKEIGQRAIALCKNLKSFSFMGEDNVPILKSNILHESGNIKEVTVFVRKKWYENAANKATIDEYNTTFKDVHPSFVTETGYDRGTEFFPTSMTNVGVISFYTPRTSVIIPKEVTEKNADASRGKTWTGTYTVSSVLDFAYENANTVQDIVFLADIGVVGLKAFKAGSQLKGIYFVGDTPATLSSTDYQQPSSYPFNANQAIYVKESKVDNYKTKWEEGNTLGITYQIPAQTLANRATASYPFNTVYNMNGDVKPYLPLEYKRMTEMSKDKAYVRARSIDDGKVPAFMGILLASKNAANATSYCQIDEDQTTTTISGIAEYDASTYYMKAAVEDTQLENTATHTLFGLAKSGVFKKIAAAGNTIPHFKSYLSIPTADIPMGAKSIVFLFDNDEPQTTGINSIEDHTTTANGPLYNLNGMRVDNPTSGVYIRNGKKVIIRK